MCREPYHCDRYFKSEKKQKNSDWTQLQKLDHFVVGHNKDFVVLLFEVVLWASCFCSPPSRGNRSVYVDNHSNSKSDITGVCHGQWRRRFDLLSRHWYGSQGPMLYDLSSGNPVCLVRSRDKWRRGIQTPSVSECTSHNLMCDRAIGLDETSDPVCFHIPCLVAWALPCWLWLIYFGGDLQARLQ